MSKTSVGGSLPLHVGIEPAFGCIIAMFLLFSSQLRRTAMQFVGENVTGHTLIFVLVIVGLMGGVPLVSFLPILPDQTLPFNTSTNKFAALPQTFSEKVVGYPRNSRTPVVQDQAILNYRAEPRILTTHVLLWFYLGSAFFLIPSSQATLVSLLCRVWMLSAELVLASVAVFLHKQTEAR